MIPEGCSYFGGPYRGQPNASKIVCARYKFPQRRISRFTDCFSRFLSDPHTPFFAHLPISPSLHSLIPSIQGGFEFKKAIVESMLSLIDNIPEAREPGMSVDDGTKWMTEGRGKELDEKWFGMI